MTFGSPSPPLPVQDPMSAPPRTATGLDRTTIRVTETSPGADRLLLRVDRDALVPEDGQAVVEIRAAGVNPSDVKAMLGAMPQAVWPRTPGRDFAGIVVDGPAGTVGREVWGSSGQLGIKRDGSHASHLLLDVACLRDKPARLSFREAGSIGVPFVTAFQGFEEAGGIVASDVVAVLGANGKVGQAAVQLAAQAGATVIAVARGESFLGFASGPVTYVDATRTPDLAGRIREISGGHGADLVYNIAGSPYFEAANKALAKRGRQMFISTLERAVPFDIFAFYRGRHRFVGIDSLALTTAECGDILDALKPGFEAGTLRPFGFAGKAVYALAEAGEAYRAVLGGEPGRIVLDPRL